MFTNLINQINSGGAVMWALIGLSFLIWALICRYLIQLEIDEDSKDSFFSYYSKYLNSIEVKKLKPSLESINSRITTDEKIIKSLIAVAPLMGLLGTVGGMIETFASLETMEMFKPSGGIASGVSQALLTTQFGLIVAVPALLFLKIVEKKRKKLIETFQIIVSERIRAHEI